MVPSNRKGRNKNLNIIICLVIDAKKRAHFENLVLEYFDSLNVHLKTEFDILKKMEKTNRHIYQQVKGILKFTKKYKIKL